MMFPGRSGGISLYANEGWRKYTTLVGPIATFGYWIGWSVVLAIFGNLIGGLIQAQWFSSSTWTVWDGVVHLQLFNFIGIGCIIVVWLFNIFGVRPFAWFTYVTGGSADDPGRVPHPRAGAGRRLAHPTTSTGRSPATSGAASRSPSCGCSSWPGRPDGVEVCATFTPEYKSRRDSTIALRSAASFSLLIFILLPFGLGGVQWGAVESRFSPTRPT